VVNPLGRYIGTGARHEVHVKAHKKASQMPGAEDPQGEEGDEFPYNSDDDNSE
jgi:hypothetical protein